MSKSFNRFATVTASTKRNPAAVSGKVGAAVAYLTGLSITPLEPVSQEIIERYQLKSPRKSYVTFVQGMPDIVDGDILVVGSAEDKVVGRRPFTGSTPYIEVVIEKVIGV